MSSLPHLTSPSGLSFLQRLQSEKIADPDLDLTRAEEIFHKTHSSASHPESNGCCYLTITWQALQEDVHRWEEIRNRAQKIYRSSAGRIRPPAKLMREASDILNTPAAMQIRYLDALTSLAKANNTKIIFMPSETSK